MAKSASQRRVDEHEKCLGTRVAADLRRLRRMHGSTLEELSDFLGHEKNWLSRIERGLRGLQMSEYLLIMSRIVEVEPDHPAKALLDHYTRGHGRKLTLIK